ncbi:ERAD-associated protein [Linderina pennispora]|nr:ERAD-associated protein [Linderina pennispora]
MAVLEPYQSRLDAQHKTAVAPKYGFKTNRDALPLLPKAVRPYVRRVMAFVADWVEPSARDSKSSYVQRVKERHTTQPANVREAINTLTALADQGYEDAVFTLASMEMHGRYGTGVDLPGAFAHYQQLSEISGNATAQYMLGFFYATALGGVEQSNSMSLLYNRFAAIQGYVPAEMTLGFRHLAGIGTTMSCPDALSYYHAVALKSVRYYLSGPPLGRHLPSYRVRLSDEHGGIFGVKTSPNSIRKTVKRDEFNEVVEYHQFKARKGDLQACVTLADLYYHGHRYSPRRFSTALTYLSEVITKGFTANGKIKQSLDRGDIQAAAQAAGMFATMHWRGEGVPVDTAQAFKWYKIGASLGHGGSLNALGKMYEEGIEIPANPEKAIDYFKKAAAKQHPGGQVNYALAVINTNPQVAYAQFIKAAESGNILAHYYLAEMYNHGIGVQQACNMATTHYRYVAEKGDWQHSPIPDAYESYTAGNMEMALIGYMQAAEMGYDVGNLNAAYLLEHVPGLHPDEAHTLACSQCKLASQKPSDARLQTCACPKPLFKDRQTHDFQTLTYWTRAANQNVADARVKQGDHYYYGRGVRPSLERAAAAYTIAAEGEGNSFAMWNLAWMYENGIGMKRDFHLAKRWYDRSLEVNEHGKLANHFSLARLCLKYLWGWATGEDVGDGPLFFTPKPVSKEEEEEAAIAAMANRANANDDDGADIRNMDDAQGQDDDAWDQPAPPRQQQHQDDDARLDGDDDDEVSLVENLFFVMVLALIGWVFVRNAQQPRPPPPNQQQ